MPSRRHLTLTAVALLSSALMGTAYAGPAKMDAVLRTVIANPDRPVADSKRDVFRHPYESLAFWGLKPGMTVMDLEPGGGYWTWIIAPYAMKTGGTYVAGVADLANPKISEGAKAGRARFEAKFADAARFGHIRYVGFGPVSGALAPPGTVDIIMTTREIHNWIPGGTLDKSFKDIFTALKPGGFLAIEDHRADPRPQDPKTADGYVNTAFVVAAAKRAGFVLDASSEINANPKDTKDHIYGVWTLPPTRESTPDGRTEDPKFDHTKYDAIGESDRMTLRFRKPG